MRFTLYILVGIPVLILFYVGMAKLIKYLWKSDINK